jgi:hypothetical protein
MSRIASAPAGPRFVDLVGIDDEVLAQHRQLHHIADGVDELELALKILFIGQNRQGVRPRRRVILGNLDRIEIRADHAGAGRGLLHLGDQVQRLIARARDRMEEIPRPPECLDRLAKLFDGNARLALGHLLALGRKNLIQDARHRKTTRSD